MEALLTKNTACLISRMEAHAAADEIIQGTGWENGKGCFVGCALHTYDHLKFESELGWPKPLAHLCDALFEALSNADAKEFAVDVPNAVGVDGKDLSMVLPQWMYWLLADREQGVIQFVLDDRFERQRTAIERVAELHRRTCSGETIASAAWAAAWAAAGAAARDAAGAAARNAAWDAAWAAAGAAARAAAGAAARAAAGAAAGAAARNAAWDAAWAAARAAAWDAAGAAARDAAGAAARAAARKQQAEKLIELLKGAPVRTELTT